MREIQYSKKVDKIIYSDLTKGFTFEDWRLLSDAAIDQSRYK